MKPPVVLLTGFGPFPGARHNPTGRLVDRLARARRPGFADVRLVAHVFPTSYRAVDRELPKLMAELAPAAILMFGLAARRRGLRIETRARNAHSALARDAEGRVAVARSIAAGKPTTFSFPPLTRRLMLAARAARVPAALSRDAGRYLCNYLCWRAIEAAAKPDGPRVVAFVHVPPLRRTASPRHARGRQSLTMDELVRAGLAILFTVIAAARSRRR